MYSCLGVLCYKVHLFFTFRGKCIVIAWASSYCGLWPVCAEPDGEGSVSPPCRLPLWVRFFGPQNAALPSCCSEENGWHMRGGGHRYWSPWWVLRGPWSLVFLLPLVTIPAHSACRSQMPVNFKSVAKCRGKRFQSPDSAIYCRTLAKLLRSSFLILIKQGSCFLWIAMRVKCDNVLVELLIHTRSSGVSPPVCEYLFQQKIWGIYWGPERESGCLLLPAGLVKWLKWLLSCWLRAL